MIDNCHWLVQVVTVNVLITHSLVEQAAVFSYWSRPFPTSSIGGAINIVQISYSTSRVILLLLLWFLWQRHLNSKTIEHDPSVCDPPSHPLPKQRHHMFLIFLINRIKSDPNSNTFIVTWRTEYFTFIFTCFFALFFNWKLSDHSLNTKATWSVAPVRSSTGVLTFKVDFLCFPTLQ